MCDYIKAVLAQAAQSEPGHSLVLRGGELRADRAFWESIPGRTRPRGECHRSDGVTLACDTFSGTLG